MAAELRGLDASRLIAHEHDKTGRTPDDLMEMTPYAFAALYLKAPEDPAKVTHTLTTEAVIEWNKMYRDAKGLAPFIPQWFLPDLRKR